MIPSNIFQTYHKDIIPEESKKRQNILKEINNQFNYFFYDSNDCINFIKDNYSNYYEIYLKYPHFAQKENLFKILIIYHFGGFFFDIDFFSQKNIEELQKYSCVFPLEKEISDKCFYKKYGKKSKNLDDLKQIGIYAFGAEKGHPLLLHILNEIVDRYNDYKIFENQIIKNNINLIEKTTGQDIISLIYHSYSELYNNIKILKGDDTKSLDVHKYCLNTWYKFGNYGDFFYSEYLEKVRNYSDLDTVRIDIKDDYNNIELEEKSCILS